MTRKETPVYFLGHQHLLCFLWAASHPGQLPLQASETPLHLLTANATAEPDLETD